MYTKHTCTYTCVCAYVTFVFALAVEALAPCSPVLCVLSEAKGTQHVVVSLINLSGWFRCVGTPLYDNGLSQVALFTRERSHYGVFVSSSKSRLGSFKSEII